MLLLPVATMATIPLYSQATASGSIVGTVTDSSSAVIAGAQVSITNVATGAKRSAVSGSDGGYRFDLLSAGIYQLAVTSAGFSTETSKIELLVGSTTTANFGLKPGEATQTVEVQATSPVVDLQKTSVSAEITPSEVQDLPMVGRDVANLAYLAPGVKLADSYDPTKSRYAIMSVNGDGGRNVNVTVNGVDNKDNTVGGPVMQMPLEAVEEYHISTQRFSAENGRSEGAAINIITKRGGNQFHGSLFGYFRDAALDTDEKDADGLGGYTKSHPDYSRQQFGGSVGGPFYKDRAFGFFALERERESQSLIEETTPYTELVLAQPYFSGDQPAATIPRPFYEWRYNGRADFTFTPKESAYVSYSNQANNSLNDQSDGSSDLTSGNTTTNQLEIANFTLNSVLSDTLVNQFTFGWQYWNNKILSSIDAPNIAFPSASFGTNVNVPQQSFQRKWQFKDDLSKSLGRHTLKAGADIIWNPVEGGEFGFVNLSIGFAQDPSCILAATDSADGSCGPSAFPDKFATPGAVNSMSQSNGDPTFLVATKQIGFYFQDDWKLGHRMTMSLGLRWDKDVNMIGTSTIKASRTYQELVALNDPFSNPYVSKAAGDDNLDFSPRWGFAYDMTGKGNHVLRGGFGMYYGNVFQNIPLFMEQQANTTIFQTVLGISATTDPVPGTGKTLGEWQYGVDPLPTIPAPSGQLTDGSVGRLMDPRYRNPITEEFNLGYTWAITPSSAFEAEYTHVQGIHENKSINIDQRVPTGTAAGDCCTAPLDAAFAASDPHLPSLSRVVNEEAIGKSHYDGINLSFKGRVTKRVNLIANYTASWANGYDSGGGSFRNYPRLATAPFASWEWGPSPNDERHHITVAGTVNIPFGFDLAPILQYGTARPWQPTNSSNALNTGGGTTNAVLVPTSSPTNWFTYAGASAATTTNCFYGLGGPSSCTIAAYDPMRGDPFFQLDLRLAKNIKFGEKFNLQLLAQAFNLTNRANYGNNFGSSITNQATFGHPAGFIAPGATTIPRSTWGEFGARFSF
jgi:hypothetical protein